MAKTNWLAFDQRAISTMGGAAKVSRFLGYGPMGTRRRAHQKATTPSPDAVGA